MTSRIKASEIIVKSIFNSKSVEYELNILSKSDFSNSNNFTYIKKLVYGVIENYITYSFYIKDLININKTSPYNLSWIYIYLYEYLGLNKNAALISNGIIDDVKKVNHKSSGFLNAVFRKLAVINETEGLEKQINKLKEPEKTKIKNSIGDWLFTKLINNYDIDKINEIAKSWIFSNRISFWINTNIKEANEIIKLNYEKLNIEKDKNFDFCYWSDKAILLTEITSKNYIYIQDLNSVEAVEHLDLEETDKVWDMCSSPGGKLLLMSRVVKDNLYSTELSKKRFSRLIDNIKTFAQSKIFTYNIDALSFEETNFDKIMLDAPCSSTGTIYKNKEILIKKVSDIEFTNLLKLQKELLEKAVNALKTDGILVYSTCSILKEENQENVKWILNKYSNLELITEKIYTSDNGPGKSGFYISKIIKK